MTEQRFQRLNHGAQFHPIIRRFPRAAGKLLARPIAKQYDAVTARARVSQTSPIGLRDNRGDALGAAG